MLILFTGLPGASKTLNMIKYVCEDDLFNLKGDDGKNIIIDDKPVKRPIYYHNINQLKLETWFKLTDDEAKKPDEIEKGAVIIYDECQDIFPVLPNSKAGNTPSHYTYMNKHRHNGHDIILVTQHPKNLNTQLRRLVNKHIHFKRIFGTTFVTRFEYQKCYDEPEDHFAKKDAVTNKIEIDKNYFDTYKSAEVHTVKRSLPIAKFIKLGFFILLTLSALGGMAYSLVVMYNNQKSPTKPKDTNQSSTSIASILDRQSPPQNDYFSSRKPRVQGLPHTAPIYDELTKPVSFPRISACVKRHSNNSCTCYSQQATPLDVSLSVCLNVVANGYFDHTKPDLARQKKKKFRDDSPDTNPAASDPESIQQFADNLNLSVDDN